MQDKVQVIQRRDLYNKSWTPELIVEEIKRLDAANCSDYNFDFSSVLKHILSENTEWFFLFDDDLNKIVGYFNLRALDAWSYSKIINGVFRDQESNVNEYPKIEGEIDFYIGGYVIDTEYRTYINFKKLTVSLVQYFKTMLDKNIMIKSIIARGLTAQGQQFCEGMGMHQVRLHKDKGVIYQIDFRSGEKYPRVADPLVKAVKDVQKKNLSLELLKLDEKAFLEVLDAALKKLGLKIIRNKN
jgi:hypothetical protein